MHWSCKYLNILYKDYDCTEFTKLVLKKQFNKIVDFPRPKRNAKERYMALQKNYPNYIDMNPVEFKDIKDGDCILMSGSKKKNHIGVACIISNTLYVLHCSAKAKRSLLQTVNELGVMGLTIEGAYKWLK